MNKYFKVMVSSFFLFYVLLFSCNIQAEEIEITTYYPSPYGVYEELRAIRMAIGEDFYDPSSKSFPSNDAVDLMVQGAITRGGVVDSASSINLGHSANTTVESEYSFMGPSEGIGIINEGADNSAIIVAIDSYVRWRSEYSLIGAGAINEIGMDSEYSFIGTGLRNSIGSSASNSAIITGDSNSISTDSTYPSSSFSFIGGGGINQLKGTQSVIVGGWNSDLYGQAGFIGGGVYNWLEADYGAIPGGHSNTISTGADFSFAAGQNATAANVNSFVWAGDGAAHSSNVDKSFNVFADLAYFDAQVGVGTSSPVTNANLTISGSVALAGQNAIGDDSVNFSDSSSDLEADDSFSASSRGADVDDQSQYITMLSSGSFPDIENSNYSASIAQNSGDIQDSDHVLLTSSANANILDSEESMTAASQTSNIRDSENVVNLASGWSDITNGSRFSAVIGGENNDIEDGLRCAIIAGKDNEIVSPNAGFGPYNSVVLGGKNNIVENDKSAIIASEGSEVSSSAEGIVLGGGYNKIHSGLNSLAAGWGAQVNHSYTWIVDFAPGNQSTRASDSFHFYGDKMYFGNTGVPKLVITDSDAGGGRPGIQFEGNGLQFFEGDDKIQDWSTAETFSFYSKMSNNRTYPAAIRVHGPSSGAWGTYLGFTHDGSNGYIATDKGSVYVMGQQHTSDKRLKKDIRKISNALDIIDELNGVHFKWRKDEFPNRKFDESLSIGVIAQELEKSLPELVNTDDEGFKSVSYIQLIPVLLEAVKEQQNQIEELQIIVKELKDEIK